MPAAPGSRGAAPRAARKPASGTALRACAHRHIAATLPALLGNSAESAHAQLAGSSRARFQG
eukprot:12262693-Alexandrium_andersonii.AAC.1